MSSQKRMEPDPEPRSCKEKVINDRFFTDLNTGKSSALWQ